MAGRGLAVSGKSFHGYGHALSRWQTCERISRSQKAVSVFWPRTHSIHRIMRNSRKWDVVVIGGANTDYLVQGTSLPRPGETIDGETFQTAPGGKGANQALAAARLGARVAFVGQLGTEERADEIMDVLCREGIDTRYVRRDRLAPTGVALILVDKHGEKMI